VGGGGGDWGGRKRRHSLSALSRNAFMEAKLQKKQYKDAVISFSLSLSLSLCV